VTSLHFKRSRSLRVLLTGLLFLSLVALSTACSSKPKAAPSTGQTLSGTDEQIFIGDTIEKNYDPNVIMKRAESFFEKEDYPEAIIEYQHFLDLHRVHTLAPYAQFKLAQSHFNMFRSVDRDADPVYKAMEAYERLLKDYPGSRYETEAAEKVRACHDLIAQAYFFVGEFYYRREAYLAAAHRFEAILNHYPEMSVAPEALYYLALTYKEIGANEWARDRLLLLAQRYPENKRQRESHKLIAELNTKIKDEALALASSNGSNGQDRNGLPLPRFGQPPAAAGAAALQPTANSDSSSKGLLCRIGLWC
jgi:outer membrane protein assembly factor BamD